MASKCFWWVSQTWRCERCLQFSTWIFYILLVASCTERKNVGILDILWYQICRAVFSGIQGCDEWTQFVNVLASIIFHVTVKLIFQGSFVTISKWSLSLIPCGVTLYSFSFAMVFKTLQQLSFPAQPKIPWMDSFCNHSQKWPLSLESFVFNLFPSTVLSNRSWRTSRYFSPLIWLVYQRMIGPYTSFQFSNRQ